MTTLPEDQRLAQPLAEGLRASGRPRGDRRARAGPAARQVVRKLIEFGYERALRQQFMAASVRLGEQQLPAIWADWNAVCARLDLPERYDLYLTQFPFANAAAIGAGTPMVVINSRCVDLFDELELRTVLGHEAGHILSEHVLYRTALMILLELRGATRLPFLAGLPLMAVRMRAARVVPRGRALLRPRGHARQPRPAGDVPDDDRARGRRQRAQARPRRLHPPGRRLRGVELGLGQAQPHAQRAPAHAQLPGPAREGGHGLGPVRASTTGSSAASSRRATSRPTRARRPATRTSTTSHALPADLQRVRRREGRGAGARPPARPRRISDWLQPRPGASSE